MKNYYVFLDECGAYGFEFSKSGTSKSFIVAAILIEDSDVDIVNSAIDAVRKKYFCGSEIKSKNVGGNYGRRLRILNEIKDLPFSVFALVVDKQSIFADHGITKNKRTFYKFINQILYQELRTNITYLNIRADEVGSNEFCIEFAKYVETKKCTSSLFDQQTYNFVNSKMDNGVQLADLIAGTLSYIYDEDKSVNIPNKGTELLNIIQTKSPRILFFPKEYDEHLFEHLEGNANYNRCIAELAYRKAQAFVDQHKTDKDEIMQKQRFVLNYLLFRFKYNKYRKYIPTKELINALISNGYSVKSEQVFRNKIIGNLRDQGVIISSSSKGYKLPSSEREISDYYQHVNSVVIPMIKRLKICNDILKSSSDEHVDYIEKTEYKALKCFLEAYSIIEKR